MANGADEVRLASIERRLDALEARCNDVLEALAERWGTLSERGKTDVGRIAKRADRGDARPKRGEGH